MSGSEVAPAPSAALFAAWEHMERKCKAFNTAFMKCKAEKRDPALCLKEGEAVTNCTYSLLADLHKRAPTEFDEYAQCLWNNSNKLPKCRSEAKAFRAKCPPEEYGADPVAAAASPSE